MGLREDIDEVRGYYTDGDCDCYMCQRTKRVLDAAEKWAAIEWNTSKIMKPNKLADGLFYSIANIDNIVSTYRASQKENK